MYSLRSCAQICDVMYKFVCCADCGCCISQMVRRRECRVWGSSALEYCSGRADDSCEVVVCRAYTNTETAKHVSNTVFI